MNDQELITAVRQSVHEVHMNVPAEQIVSRSRAIVDSTTPTATARASIAAAKTGQSSHAEPVVNGTATRTSRAPKTKNLRAAP